MLKIVAHVEYDATPSKDEDSGVQMADSQSVDRKFKC